MPVRTGAVAVQDGRVFRCGACAKVITIGLVSDGDGSMHCPRCKTWNSVTDQECHA